MSSLSDLPNIGKVLERNLTQAGICSAQQLRALGTTEAFLRICKIDPGACIRMLYGLHGAVLGVKDTKLDVQTKEELKAFFRGL